MQDECRQALPDLVTRGLEEFNRRQFFEQHETLETAWRQESGPIRDLYQGILQVGVACYHIEQGNREGALKLFERGLRHLRPFAPECLGVDVAGLIAGAEHARDEVQRLGPDGLKHFDRSFFPHVGYAGESKDGGHGI